MIRDGGPDQTQAEPSLAIVTRNDIRTYPQVRRSQQLAIDHEAGVLGDLVVELHRGVVGLVRLPVHPGRSGEFCLLIDAVDEGPADALAARGFGW